MKYHLPKLLIALFASILISCTTDSNDENCGTKTVSGVKKQLNIGSEGGCYYINDNGNKSYVDRSECKC